jgi:hypothetical protein
MQPPDEGFYRRTMNRISLAESVDAPGGLQWPGQSGARSIALVLTAVSAAERRVSDVLEAAAIVAV